MTFIHPGRLFPLWNKINIFLFFILSCYIFVCVFLSSVFLMIADGTQGMEKLNISEPSELILLY